MSEEGDAEAQRRAAVHEEVHYAVARIADDVGGSECTCCLRVMIFFCSIVVLLQTQVICGEDRKARAGACTSKAGGILDRAHRGICREAVYRHVLFCKARTANNYLHW